MAKSRKKIVTRLELADELGKNPRTIAKWQEECLPIVERGRGGRPSTYDLEAYRALVDSRVCSVTRIDAISGEFCRVLEQRPAPLEAGGLSRLYLHMYLRGETWAPVEVVVKPEFKGRRVTPA